MGRWDVSMRFDNNVGRTGKGSNTEQVSKCGGNVKARLVLV